MHEVADNEYKCDQDERIWITFDTINWQNLDIQMEINGGGMQPLNQHFYSFKMDGKKRDFTFSFDFIKMATCDISAYGENGGDQYAGAAHYMPGGPDLKQLTFIP